MASKPKSAAKADDAFFAETRSWETDRVIQAKASEKRAWWVAIAGALAGLGGIFAVAAMLPLKQTELRVLEVDKSTGIVNIVSTMPDAKSSYSEVVNKYFLQQYVRYREGYSRELAEEYYNNIGLMSSSSEQTRFAEFFSPKNPLSPLNVYGANTRVRVTIKSVSFIKENVALVRYMKEIDRSAGERPSATHWAATIVFRYVGSPMTDRDRAVNPLGFQVVEYRNDMDAQADAAAAAPAPAPAAVVAPVDPSTGQPVMAYPGVPGAAVPATR